MDDKSRGRIKIMLILALFLATFVFVNAQEYGIASVIYLIMGVLSLNLYSQWGTVGKVSDLEGIDGNFIHDAFIGFMLGVGTIVLGKFVSFIGVIGIPQVQSIAGTVGRFLIVVPIAAIFEEVFFRDFLIDFFDSKIGLPKILSNLFTAFGFSLFHLAAYGDSLSAASGSFFSAALMGFIFGLVSERQNSLAGSIAYHMTLNAWIGFVKLSVVLNILTLIKYVPLN